VVNGTGPSHAPFFRSVRSTCGTSLPINTYQLPHYNRDRTCLDTTTGHHYSPFYPLLRLARSGCSLSSLQACLYNITCLGRALHLLFDQR
jgi:hypothetical protein